MGKVCNALNLFKDFFVFLYCNLISNIYICNIKDFFILN